MNDDHLLPKIPAGKFVKNGDEWCIADKYVVMSCGCGDPARMMTMTSCCMKMTQSTRYYDAPIDSAPVCDDM